MKRKMLLILIAIVLTLETGRAQTTPVLTNPQPPPVTARARPAEMPPQAPVVELTKFDLDFPGGAPSALVKAIEKAMGRPLNVIITEEFAATPLPALKMKAVNVKQLFDALQTASMKSVRYPTGYSSMGGGGRMGQSFQIYQTAYSFRPASKDAITDDTIWSFYCEKPPVFEEAKVCHFYQLSGYLEQWTIDDITTAIQTGYKMLGEKSIPTLNFHKDTGLLIVVGEEDKLQLIDAVLQQLRGVPMAPAPRRTPAPEKIETAPKKNAEKSSQ